MVRKPDSDAIPVAAFWAEIFNPAGIQTRYIRGEQYHLSKRWDCSTNNKSCIIVVFLEENIKSLPLYMFSSDRFMNPDSTHFIY